MVSAVSPSQATLVDRAYQLGYRAAYQVMRTYWRLRKPTTNGALVAIWSRGEVLLVRNSYIPYYSAPGGYVRPSESGRDAVLRELVEEVGVTARPEELELALDVTHEWEGKHDHVQIFNLQLSERPALRIDHREVVEASWFSPERALQLEHVFPPLRRVIESSIAAA
jgi:8-oxo-dGTP diphosphatase